MYSCLLLEMIVFAFVIIVLRLVLFHIVLMELRIWLLLYAKCHSAIPNYWSKNMFTFQ